MFTSTYELKDGQDGGVYAPVVPGGMLLPYTNALSEKRRPIQCVMGSHRRSSFWITALR